MRGLRIRTVVLAAIGLILAGFIYWFSTRDPGRPLVDIPPVNTQNYIAALKETNSGERVVAITPEGTIKEPVAGEEISDKEIVWKPDGRRILFVSNRAANGSFQIFEWIPDRDNKPYQLTLGTASRQNPWFLPDGSAFTYASQGAVLITNYDRLRSRRLMPPSAEPDEPETEEGQVRAAGDEHEHDVITQAWSSIAQALEGDAFTHGFVDSSRKFFAGIYTTARGTVFVTQFLDPQNQDEARARAWFGGNTIQASFDAEKAISVVSIVEFYWPIRQAIPEQFINPDGTAKRAFVNAVFIVDAKTNNPVPLFLSQDGQQALTSPALSPDGSEVAFVVREKSGDSYESVSLAIAPVKEGGASEAKFIAQGKIESPAWSPDGEQLTFIRDGDVWTIRRDGSAEKNLTQGKGRFRTPKFSPMR